MNIVPATFRASFPEFANEVKYPDAQITFWSGVGEKLLNESRWGDLLEIGMNFYIAHHISVSAQESANASGVAGQGVGLRSSKSVGGLSVSYYNTTIAEEGGGNYNLTFYGRELLLLSKLIGIGGLQILEDLSY
jgi:hypothetical protein